MNVTAIHIHQFGFRYPNQKTQSLSNINLSIKAGERFGLFGPNGAGKTTLMSCMTGLLSSKEGELSVLGSNLSASSKIKKYIGFVPQDFAFYQELSPSENFDFFGALSGMTKQKIREKTNELISVLEIDDTKQVRYLSGGMKRRVNLAIGVLHEPKLLFLDEPTVGVDVHTRRAIVSYLKELNKKGTTLIYTSHQLNEAEELCENIALIHEGQIIAYDSLKNLLLIHRAEGLEGLFVSLTGKKFEEANA